MRNVDGGLGKGGGYKKQFVAPGHMILFMINYTTNTEGEDLAHGKDK